jgi:hypothetical protein
MTRSLLAGLFVLILLIAPTSADQYRVTVRRLDKNLYQAVASKVIIETRLCFDLAPDQDTEEAILNWEGRYGNNWLLFTGSKAKCDVAAIR